MCLMSGTLFKCLPIHQLESCKSFQSYLQFESLCARTYHETEWINSRGGEMEIMAEIMPFKIFAYDEPGSY